MNIALSQRSPVPQKVTTIRSVRNELPYLEASANTRALPMSLKATRDTCARHNSNQRNLLKPRRLAGGFKDGHPEVAIGVHLIAFSNGQRNRDVYEAAVPAEDDHFGAATHRGVNGVVRQT